MEVLKETYIIKVQLDKLKSHYIDDKKMYSKVCGVKQKIENIEEIYLLGNTQEAIKRFS